MIDKQITIDEIKLHRNRKDLTGLKVGKLTCLKPVKTGKNKHSEWLCECECGNFKIAQTYRLLSGRIQSCGDCYHTINHYIPMIKELEKQLKAKEQECEELRQDIKDIANLLDLDTGEEYNFGNIESAIKNYCADCDVAERMRKVTYAATGGRLSYANYTVEAIEQAYNDQLRIDVEYRTKELEEQLDQLKAENEKLDTENKRLVAELANPVFDSFEELDKLKQTLTEIKEIAEKAREDLYTCESIIYADDDLREILQKISEVEDGV